MVTLTKVFKVNRIINSIVEIVKTINGYTEYTLVLKNSIYFKNEVIMINPLVFKAKKDFFTKVRSI